jgi:hypothetical protein
VSGTVYGIEGLKEEHGSRMFENRVLRRIFGPERGLVAGDWRKVHSEELHNLDFLPDTSRIIKSSRMSRACSMHENNQKLIQNFGERNLKEKHH